MVDFIIVVYYWHSSTTKEIIDFPKDIYKYIMYT